MMKRFINVDMTIHCKNHKTAVARFIKKYPEAAAGWEEYLENIFAEMKESGKDYALECDNLWGNGEPKEWEYAIHTQINEDSYYIAIVQRKEI